MVASQLILAAVMVLQGPGGDWEELRTLSGAQNDTLLGWSLAGVGDADGDGVPDLLVGAPGYGPLGIFESGEAVLYSGATWTPIWSVWGTAVSQGVGDAVAGYGDWNGDGFADCLVAAPGQGGTGAVHLLSGPTGTVLLSITGAAAGDHFGDSVATIGDVDGDGLPEIVVGVASADVSGLTDAGAVELRSGATGALLWQFPGNDADGQLGRAVARTGDVDGDGVDEVLAAAPLADTPGGAWAGRVWLLSGASGSVLRTYEGSVPNRNLGRSVAGLGDLDGDGVEDYGIGAIGNPSTLFVHSGATGTVLYTFDGDQSYDQTGASLAGAGDLDGDGVPDILVGSPNTTVSGNKYGAGAVHVLSGRTGVRMGVFYGNARYDSVGYAVAVIGDVDGDGRDDFAHATPWEDNWWYHNIGRVHVWSLDPFLVADATEVSAGGGPPVSFTLDFPASEAGQSYALLASLGGIGPSTVSGIQIPLTWDWLFGRMLNGWIPPQTSGFQGVLDGAGDAQATLSGGPALAAWVGTRVYLAAVSYTPPGTGRLASVVRAVDIVP